MIFQNFGSPLPEQAVS